MTGMSLLPQRLKDRVRILASTNRFVATGVATVLGLGGLARGRRGSIEHLKSTFSMVTQSTTVLGRPLNVTIEPTNRCNLECPVCETGAGVLGRANGSMSLDDFRRILDDVGAHTNTLMFYFMGEPMLNRHAYDMIRLAKSRGIPFVETCTNGDFVNAEKLVESGLDRVSFQIGGMTQETHETYRVNGRLDRVMKNLQDTIRVRRERGSSLQIEAGFILMKHNEHEVDDFKRTMAELGVDRTVVIDACVRTMEQGRAFLPSDQSHWIYDPLAFSRGELKPRALPNNSCPWLYYSLAIHVNGDVVPCCRDPKGLEVVGNIFDEPFDSIWNGPKFRDFRRRVQTEQASIEICRLCSAYPPSVIH